MYVVISFSCVYSIAVFLCLFVVVLVHCIFKGAIYINGIPIDEMREWYIANTGYVLQLATPYYEELTVRDNLTLAAQIILGGMTFAEKFRRVEQVMHVVSTCT